MQHLDLLAVLFIPLALLACKPQNSATSSPTAEQISKACMNDLNDQGWCNCIGDSAQTKLSETQRRLLFVHLNADDVAFNELQRSMTEAEVHSVTSFLGSSPAFCLAD